MALPGGEEGFWAMSASWRGTSTETRGPQLPCLSLVGPPLGQESS